MLILQRKAGESLLIGDQIKVTVVSVEAGAGCGWPSTRPAA